MIIIERLARLVNRTVRNIYWLITAKDCNHCSHFVPYIWVVCCCELDDDSKKECERSIRRCHFERRPKNDR